jgi:predicted permease
MVQPYSRLPEGRGAVAVFLSMLMGVVALLLVIACANVAGIGLARAAARKREIAVRFALGASRGRVIRQLVTETLTVFAIAAGIGVIMSQCFIMLLDRLRFQIPFPVVPVIDLSTDYRVVFFNVSLTAVAAIISGLTPALYGTGPDVATAMKEDSMASTYRRSRLRSGLVVAQVALSFVLLFGGGLFLRTLVRVATTDLGFDPTNVQVVSLDFSLAGIPPAEAKQLERELLVRVSSLPEVESASLALDLPMDLNAVGLGGISVIGHEPPRGQQAFPALWNVVSPGYFKTLKIPLLRGRDFNEMDREGSPSVAIINETMAAQFWSGLDAVGRTFYRRGGPSEESRVVQVIGVVKNVNTRGINEEPAPFIHVPYAQDYRSGHELILRPAPGADIVPAVRQLVRELNPNLPIITFRSMDNIVGFGLLPQRLAAWVAGVMGLVGVILAGLGIYGVTSFAVSSRTREIGIRLAVGAKPGRILALIAREGMMLAGVGLGLGMVAAVGLAQAIRTFVYVSPTDIITFGAVAMTMAAAALVASYLPSRRATRIDPVVALRHI